MPQCNRCPDTTEYEWYEDQYGKWKLGIKLDVNNYRPHICITKTAEKTEYPNRRGWNDFICEKCGNQVKQSKKHFSSKDLKLCLECKSSDTIS